MVVKMSPLILIITLCFMANNDYSAFALKSSVQYSKSSKFQLNAIQKDWVSPTDKVKALRRMLFENDGLTIMPCCYDGLTARLVEQAGFDLTFMTGFGVSSTYGLPDTGRITMNYRHK
jgi:Phosphoenolpyruvate phosphomutase